MTIWKPALVGATALVIVGSTVVYAQQRQDGRRWQPSIDDARAFADARLAALKAGLALNAEQEKNWPAFEQAARDFQKLRLDRLSAGIDARRSGQPRLADPVERLQSRATALSASGAALKKLADATGPLYASLDDAQKRRFGMLSRMTMGDRFGSDQRMRMHDRMMRDGFPRGMRRSEAPGLDGPGPQGHPMQGLDGRSMQDHPMGRMEGFDMRMRRPDGRSSFGLDAAPMRDFMGPRHGEEDL